QDDEPFALDALDSYAVKSRLLQAAGTGGTLLAGMQEEAARMQRSGELPMLDFGRQLVEQLVEPLTVQLEQYRQRLQALVADETPLLLETGGPSLRLQSWLGGVFRLAGDTEQAAVPVLVTGALRDSKKQW